MINLSELKIKAGETGVDIAVLERDYVISWALNGIYNNSVLRNGLVFKGGTALRKIYFPDYRFSEDLDFTTAKPLSELGNDELEQNLKQVCDWIYQNSGIEIHLQDFTQTRDEMGEEAFLGKLQYVGPRGHRVGSLPRIKLDITYYEKVVLKPNELPILHNYSDKSELTAKVASYRLEEVLAEKLRAILQRQRSRDIYDIWHLLKFHADKLDLATVKKVFHQKCDYKNVAFNGVDDFFSPELLESHRLAWEPSMRRQLPDLPKFSEVEKDLADQLFKLFVD